MYIISDLDKILILLIILYLIIKWSIREFKKRFKIL